MVFNLTMSDLPVDVFNLVIPFQANSSQFAFSTTSNDIYKPLAKKIVEYLVLQDYLFANLKFIRRKQKQLIACGLTTMQMSFTIFNFFWE